MDLNRWVGTDAPEPRTVLLNFASYDCEPCKKELAALREHSERMEEAGALFAVVIMDPTAEARDQMLDYLMGTLQLPFPVVVDPPGQIVTRNYGVSSLPHTVLIDQGGVIRWVSQGFKGEASLEALFAAIETHR